MSQFAESLLPQLVRCTLWLTIAGLAAAALLRLARIQSPSIHRACWCVTLLVGCFLVRFPIDVPWYEPEPIAPLSAPSELPPYDPEPYDPEPFDLSTVDPGLDTLSPMPAEVNAVPLEAPIVSAPPPVPRPMPKPQALRLPSLSALAIGAWLAGIFALAAGWLAGYCWFVWRIPSGRDAPADWQAQLNELQTGQGGSRPIPLRVTPNLGPMLCRLPRGYELLVPEPLWRKLNAVEREAILRHELAHRRRGDVWKSLAARALAVVHWFNPVSWWAARRFDEAAEWACDRAAVTSEPAAYARILMHLGELAAPGPRYGQALRGRPLAARIRRLVSTEQKEDSTMKKALLISVATSLVLAALVRVQLVAQEPAEPPDKEPGRSANAVEALFAEGDSGQDEPLAAGPAAEPAQSPSVSEAKRKMVEAAERAFMATRAAWEASTRPLEAVCMWSNRWLSAALSVARNREERIAAAEANLKRMQQTHQKVALLYREAVRGGEADHMATANYYVADAERRLAEIKSKPKLRLPQAPKPPAATPPKPRPAVRPVPIPNAVPRPVLPRSVPPAAAPPAVPAEPRLPAATPPPVEPPPQRAVPPIGPVDQSPPVRPRKPAAQGASRNLLYGGRDFDAWVADLRTDLSPERRAAATKALAAFGANGYGRAAAEALLEVAHRESLGSAQPRDHNLSSDIPVAFQKIPRADAMPLLVEELKSDDADHRVFALYTIPHVLLGDVDELRKLIAPSLEDPDIRVRATAAQTLVTHHPEAPGLIEVTRELLGADDDSAESGLGVVQTLVYQRMAGVSQSAAAARAIEQLRDAAIPVLEKKLLKAPNIQQPPIGWSKQTQDLLDALRETPKVKKQGAP